MTRRRGRARGTFHPSRGIIAVGGTSDYATTLQSSLESTQDGISFRSDYAPLPVATDLHCQVAVDDDTLFVAGGRFNQSHSFNTAFLLDIRYMSMKCQSLLLTMVNPFKCKHVDATSKHVGREGGPRMQRRARSVDRPRH